MKATIPPGHRNSSCNNQTLFNSMGKCSNNYPEKLVTAATRGITANKNYGTCAV